ncbi:hypothetical protein D3C77_638010 [compost metagenome]
MLLIRGQIFTLLVEPSCQRFPEFFGTLLSSCVMSFQTCLNGLAMGQVALFLLRGPGGLSVVQFGDDAVLRG